MLRSICGRGSPKANLIIKGVYEMRALILVAAAALAVSACSKNEAAENTMNVDETLVTENAVANDTMAVDAANGTDAAMAADANATDANATAETTNAM